MWNPQSHHRAAVKLRFVPIVPPLAVPVQRRIPRIHSHTYAPRWQTRTCQQPACYCGNDRLNQRKRSTQTYQDFRDVGRWTRVSTAFFPSHKTARDIRSDSSCLAEFIIAECEGLQKRKLILIPTVRILDACNWIYFNKYLTFYEILMYLERLAINL